MENNQMQNINQKISKHHSYILAHVILKIYSYLNLTQTNYPAYTVFNFFYKEVMDHVIFVNHVLRLSNIL
jgi:hypothetical protein